MCATGVSLGIFNVPQRRLKVTDQNNATLRCSVVARAGIFELTGKKKEAFCVFRFAFEV